MDSTTDSDESWPQPGRSSDQRLLALVGNVAAQERRGRLFRMSAGAGGPGGVDAGSSEVGELRDSSGSSSSSSSGSTSSASTITSDDDSATTSSSDSGDVGGIC